MRNTVLILLFSALQVFATGSYAQSKKISLAMNDATIREVLYAIQKQSEFYFLYNSELIDVAKKVNITIEEEKVDKILTRLFNKNEVDFLIKDRYIVLTPVGGNAELFAEQQQRTVSGTVTDESGLPLPGVTVLIKGTTQGTVTNADGSYSLLNIPDDATLIFSFVGMKKQEIVVAGKSQINVMLAEESIGIEEVIAIGYGTIRKSDVTGSVQHLNATQFETQPSTNFIEMLSGTVAGFNSSTGTSAKGGGSMEIRGQASLNANNSPLVVVDGVIFNGFLEDINPSDIESIDILKDASSAAIFGARSSAGVLIITTKRGTSEKPTINVSSSLGVTGLTHNMRPYDGEGYLERRAAYFTRTNTKKPTGFYTNPNKLPDGISLDQWRAFDGDPANTPEEVWANRLVLQNIEKQNYLAGKTTDWYDEIFRNGIRQNYDLSLSGGTHSFKYYWSLGYTDNEGVSLGDDFKTIRSRINFDADVTDFLKVGLNAQFADRDESNIKTLVDHNNSNLPQWIDGVIRQSPFGQIYDDEGNVKKYAFDDSAIPNVLSYYYLSDKMDKFQTMFASLYGELKLPFGFSYKVTYTNRYSWRKNYYYDPSTTLNGSKSGGIGTRMNTSAYEWQVDNLINWNKTINDIQKIDVTFLVNAEKRQFWSDEMSNTQFSPSEELTFHALGAGITPSVTSTDEYSTGNALMARLNYSLLDRYLLTATWRRDGYSAFGQLNPYAEFPSMALGWKISEESFFKANWVSFLKLRLSWGLNGNRAVGIYDALARLASSQYLYGTTLATGVYSSTMANKDLKWEKTEALNLGIDFGLLNNKITGNVEVYSMTTKDLLLRRTLPRIIGYTSVAANLGELENKGVEITLNSTNIDRPNIKWTSSLLFSLNRNKIKHLYGDMEDVVDEDGNVTGQKEADDWTNGWFIGQALDRVWDYKVLGVWQVDEAEEAAKYGMTPGDMKLWDVNADGKILQADDKVFQGYKKPRYHLGLRNDFRFLKNFEISAFIKADIDFDGQNNLYINANNVFFERWNGYSVPYWTPENPSNEWAAPASNDLSENLNVWKNRSYVRLQDVSVSYIFPKSVLSKTKIQNMKVYVNFRNLMTITGWENWDPESKATPMPKYSTIGINLTL